MTFALVALSRVWTLKRIVFSVAVMSRTPETIGKPFISECVCGYEFERAMNSQPTNGRAAGRIRNFDYASALSAISHLAGFADAE